MRSALSHALAEKVGLDLTPAINIVIAYEDIADGRRAMQTYNGLVGEVGRDGEFGYELWKFEALQSPQLREVAAQQAREANMIIVATRSRTLPRSVRNWIEAWVRTGSNRPRALVALMAGSEPLICAAPVFVCLREAATRAGMEFFPHVEELPVESSVAGLSIERLRQRADTSSAVLDGILNRDRPAPRWGINE